MPLPFEVIEVCTDVVLLLLDDVEISDLVLEIEASGTVVAEDS
jgi:hypothetical protein